MSRKSKINPIEKVKIVERYLRGEIGMRQAGKELVQCLLNNSTLYFGHDRIFASR